MANENQLALIVGAGAGLAYGIILQAVEVVTALALGIPAVLGEGLSWRDIRAGGGRVENSIRTSERSPASSAGESAQ